MSGRRIKIDPAKSSVVEDLTEEVASTVPKDPPIVDISLDDLLGKHLLILYRETRSLLSESSTGKLNRENAQCLRDNLKLLLEMKDREKVLLEDIRDEDLEKAANADVKGG